MSVAIKPHFEDFSRLWSILPPRSKMHALYDILKTHRATTEDATKLNEKRNNLRRSIGDILKEESINQAQPIFTWIAKLLRVESSLATFEARQFLETSLIDIYHCCDLENPEAAHVELSQTPRTSVVEHWLRITQHGWDSPFKGDISLYLQDYFSASKTAGRLVDNEYPCWRSSKVCSGYRTDMRDLVLSIPVVLVIELERGDSARWNIPLTVVPQTQSAANDHGVIYDLVGFALFSKGHFIAHYISGTDGVYTHDGTTNGGRPIRNNQETLSSQSLPEGYQVHAVFYRLRGGVNAQAKFYELRTTHLRIHSPLRLTRLSVMHSTPTVSYCHPNFYEMAKKNRFWKDKPSEASTTEYLTHDRTGQLSTTEEFSRDQCKKCKYWPHFNCPEE
ncbi:hypothetical protein DXG03_006337 [Asterophora parasitica]|uniref:USP domain-containing protein n=1 Tax=Asterophora parasitica TaxID=117018 RepID=A0A9P7G7N3_9AGAR|nr:hypothetical protein DXG03_006337 [Asterophora parasitica]